MYSVIILDFMRRGEDNRGIDNPAGHHPIRTIDAPTFIILPILCQMPFLLQPIYPGLEQAPNVLDCIPGGLVIQSFFS